MQEEVRSLQESSWNEWKQHPQTQIFFKLLRRQYEETKEDWASEAFVGSNGEETVAKTAYALGGVRILRTLINKTAAELAEDMESLGE